MKLPKKTKTKRMKKINMMNHPEDVYKLKISDFRRAGTHDHAMQEFHENA